MTDTTIDSAAPPKKRFGFKKAAWQTAPKTEAQDMFSHANEFNDIVAEEARRKLEAKKKAEQARKRKVSEEHQPKRRKVSVDEEVPCSRLKSSPKDDRVTRKGRSKTPLSPTHHDSPCDSLAARYDSLTKSSSSSVGAARKPDVVDLGSDSDDEDALAHAISPSPRPIPIHSRPDIRRETSEEIEEVDDPQIAAITAQARTETAVKAARKESTPAAETSSQTPTPQVPVAIVELLITSDIPDTKPLKIKVKSDMILARAKEAWCEKQGFTPQGTSRVFITWKDRRIYENTKIQRLGLQIKNGFVTIKDDPTIYDEENLPKIHIEAWTEETLKKRKEEDALEAARAKNQIVEVEEPEPVPEPEQEAQKIRLFLKAKGRDDFKIVVRNNTSIEQLTNAYKNSFDIPKEQPITLMFDGDRLKPMDLIEDLEIEDLDALEVHFK